MPEPTKYTSEQLEKALRKADAAGDTEAAREIAKALQEQSSIESVDKFAKPMSIPQASAVSGRQGLQFGLADEAAGMRRTMGIPKWADTAIQMTPFGNAQNVGLGLGGLFAENKAEGGAKLPAPYVQGRDAERADLAKARTDRPATSIVSEIAGSVAYPAGTLKMGAPVLKEGLKLGAIGAAQGGLYGYAASEGDTSDRAVGGALGAGLGGTIGAITPGAAQAVLPYFRAGKGGVAEFGDWLAGKVGLPGGLADKHTEEVARAAIMRSMERSGMTPVKIKEALDKFGDKPAVLAEVIGQDAVNALSALTRRPGSTPQKAQAIIEDRFGGFVDRAQGDLEKATGFQRGEFGQGVESPVVQTEIKARQEAARPVYDQAYAQFPQVSSQRLAQLANDSPVLKSAMAQAEKRLANEAASQGRPVSEMSQLQFWDLVKRELDQAETAAKAKPGGGETVRQIEIIRKPLVAELDAVTDGAYAAAREVGGNAPRLREAFTSGERALGAKPAGVIQAEVEGLNPQDAPWFKAGMTGNLSNRLEKGQPPTRFRVPDVQKKVRAGLGEEEGGSFLKAMEAEASLRETGARWAPRMNSVTGTVLENGADDFGSEAMAATAKLLTGDKLGFLRDIGGWMRRRGYSQKQIDTMGDLLLSNPQEGLRRLGVALPPGGPTLPGGGSTGGALGRGFEPSREVPATLPPPPPPLPSRVRSNGLPIGPNAQNAAYGGFLGGVAPADSDEERLRNMAGGVLIGGGARGAGRLVDDVMRGGKSRLPPPEAAPAGAVVPKPAPLAPSQTAARFDPEIPLFRGSDDPTGALDGPGNADGWHGDGIYLTTSADDAGKYSTRGAGKRAELMDDQIALAERAGDQEAVARLTAQRDRVAQPGTPNVKELRAQIKNPVTLDNNGGTVWQPAEANRLIDALVGEIDDAGITYGASIGQKLKAQLQKDGRLTAGDFERTVRAEADEDFIRAETSPGQVISKAYQALGYDGIVMKNASDVLPKGSTPKGTTHVVVFDPAKLQTPGQSSPILTAGAGGGKPRATKLDKSDEVRLARAREQGFDTDTIVYHGTNTDFKAFDPKRSIGGQYWSTTNKAAVEAREVGAQGNGVIKAMYQRIKNPAGWAEYDKYGVDELIARGYDGLKLPDRDGHFTFVAFHPNQYRSVDAAFDPEKVNSPILSAGFGAGDPPKPRAPKPDSPEAIKAAVKGIATKKAPEPTRLEQMVEEGKDASVPPIKGMPDQDVALAEQAMRMEQRGLSPIEIYDKTGVALVPYNGGQVPIISRTMGPEELTRKFYGWLAEPASKRPNWVNSIIARAPKKKGLLLNQKTTPPQQAQGAPEQPLPPAGIPYGAIAAGAGVGAATGIPAGALIGYGMTRDQNNAGSVRYRISEITDRLRNQSAQRN